MSHTTKLKSVVIRDVAALMSAVTDLKAAGVACDLVRNQRPRMYYSNQHGECDYVLQLKNSSYDVGFEKQEDGSYVPVFDEWSNHVSSQLGAGPSCPMPDTPEGRAQHQIGKFFQNYSKHAAINAATMQGYMVESANTDEDGNVNLIFTGM